MSKNERIEKISKKAAARSAAETKRCLDLLRNRADYAPCYEYFLDLAESGMNGRDIAARVGRPLVNLLCIQAPVELIHAMGFHPFKIFCGTQSAQAVASHGLPALMCPLVKSILGSLLISDNDDEALWVLPTTCDWIVKFPETAQSMDIELPSLHWMELPHLKDGQKGQDRWLEEVYGLRDFLLEHGGTLRTKELARSIALYQSAWGSLTRLAEMRALGSLADVWFMLAANTFFCDSPERWTEAADRIPEASPATAGTDKNDRKIFLAGSPIFFPNFKIPLLIEEAGLVVAADDLCSSERVIPGAVAIAGTSQFELMQSLAQRYHQGCLCPTFIDNDRRIHNILGRRSTSDFKGVLFHVLKGCHPYDLEGWGIENGVRDAGLKFMRIETDYTAEDSQNLLTRLEAFRATLGGD